MRHEGMIIRVMGGLGNQMFQYALYKKLEMSGKNTVLDDRDILKHGNQHNGLELKRVFDINYRKMNMRDILTYDCWKIICLMSKRFGIHFNDTYCLKDDYKISYQTIEESSYEYLLGYWQNPLYFDDIRDVLLSDFTFKIQNMDERTSSLVQKIKKSESVSVHIRRGDYLLIEGWNQICTLGYYKKAIKYIDDKLMNAKFYFFSDDPAWVRKNFIKNDYTVIDWNLGENSFYDMYFMSICKHNIIANSTFSWWGAWLNTYENKIVVCPSKWLPNVDLDPTMDTWVKISNI